ncbi:MAG: lysozyme inhibitor LprI family protein, partial [Acidithiobacillus sp.]
MIRQFILGMTGCMALCFGVDASAADTLLNCPAIAANTPDGFVSSCHNASLTPLQSAICHYKPKVWTDSLLTLDSTVGVHYVRDLRAAGAGTPQCKDLLESHKAYEKELQGCGSNGDCVLKVMRNWAGTLSHFEDRLRPPLDEAALKKFAGGMKFQDGQQAVSLLKRLEQGMDLYPLPQMALPNGNVLVWGFQPHNAQVQSLAVVNRQGAVQLLGIVDGLYLAL